MMKKRTLPNIGQSMEEEPKDAAKKPEKKSGEMTPVTRSISQDDKDKPVEVVESADVGQIMKNVTGIKGIGRAIKDEYGISAALTLGIISFAFGAGSYLLYQWPRNNLDTIPKFIYSSIISAGIGLGATYKTFDEFNKQFIEKKEGIIERIKEVRQYLGNPRTLLTFISTCAVTIGFIMIGVWIYDDLNSIRNILVNTALTSFTGLLSIYGIVNFINEFYIQPEKLKIQKSQDQKKPDSEVIEIIVENQLPTPNSPSFRKPYKLDSSKVKKENFLDLSISVEPSNKTTSNSLDSLESETSSENHKSGKEEESPAPNSLSRTESYDPTETHTSARASDSPASFSSDDSSRSSSKEPRTENILGLTTSDDQKKSVLETKFGGFKSKFAAEMRSPEERKANTLQNLTDVVVGSTTTPALGL